MCVPHQAPSTLDVTHVMNVARLPRFSVSIKKKKTLRSSDSAFFVCTELQGVYEGPCTWAGGVGSAVLAKEMWLIHIESYTPMKPEGLEASFTGFKK